VGEGAQVIDFRFEFGISRKSDQELIRVTPKETASNINAIKPIHHH